MIKRRILSLDISTTTIGISLLEVSEDGYLSLAYCDYYKPPKEGNLFERLSTTRDYIKSEIIELSPTDIAIEDIIQYMPKSTAATIIALAQINRVIGLCCYDLMGAPPTLFDVNKIRRTIKLGKLQPKKEDIPSVIEKHLGIKFPYIMKIKGKNKGKPIIENYDMADSIAVGLCYYYLFVKEK